MWSKSQTSRCTRLTLGANRLPHIKGHVRPRKHFLELLQHLLLGAVTNLLKILLIGWLPAIISISENFSPAESTSRTLEDFPQWRRHLSNRPTTGFISPTNYRFPGLILPLWLLQIKVPQLLFPNRLLYNPYQVTVKPGPGQISVQLRLPSRATDD